ncbi:MAG: peptide chain release factor aRF-1 [Nanoarchaeota archaeon]
MELTGHQQYALKKFIKELEQHKGRHTELVSVYIPQGYELTKIIAHLAQEQGTASNIKSTSTRKNVIDALEKMIQHLRLFKRTPENGLACFAGNVAEREGVQDFKVWSIEPPIPLKTRIYRCDKDFQLDLLRDMLEVKEVFGLIVMDRREATIAILKGKAIIPMVNTHSYVPGKFKAGGQSAHRFAQLREGAAKDFYKKVAEYVKEQFLGKHELKGIIVGGPGPTKYEWVDGGYITTEVRNKIIAIKDLTYTDEFGLQELLDKSQDVLAAEGVADEKKIMNKFLTLLATRPLMVSYGEVEVEKNLSNGVVETLLISETLEEGKVEHFEEIAKKFGTNVEIISIETREGVQLRDLGKIAALNRYEIHE